MPAVCMRSSARALVLLILTQHTSDAVRSLPVPVMDFLSNEQFVPERHSFEWLPCDAELVHCGQDYFFEVYQQFQKANEIIVMGWWTVIDAKIFSPTYGQPPSLTMKDLIKDAANRGATIYYLFWQTLLSEKMGYPVAEPAAELRALHPNVKTLVDTSRDTVTVLWSAHIKVTIFDRSLAYAGGIDFAGSRLDSARHELPDQARTPSLGNLKDGQHGYFKPWEDVMVKLTGEAAEDLATVAVERWWTWCESFSFTSKKECQKEEMPPLTSLGSLSVKLLSKAEGTEHVVLQTDGAYNQQRDTQMTAKGQAAVLDLGARRDLSKRAVLKVTVVTKTGHLFAEPPAETSTTPFQGDLCTVVTGGRKAEFYSFKGCTCEGDARIAGKDPACKTEEMRKQYDAKELLGLGCFCQDYSKTLAVVDLRSDSPKEVTVAGARLEIQHSKKAAALAASAQNQCRMVLQGSNMWFGARQVVADIFQEHRQMIVKAERSVYIENQYFGSRLSKEVMSERCSELNSFAKNDLAELLFQKITTKARNGDKFSAVIIIPLATEESETQYPNLRTAQCLVQALEEFWKTNSIGRPLSEYFGMYVLANAKTVDQSSSAFYGIFVHSKLIAIDYDTEGAEGIVGSANLNDRSLLGDRDAEVSVAVRGPFVKAMVSKLIEAHTDSSISLPSSADLQTSLSVVAETNAERLLQIGIDWSQGTVEHTKKLLDQNVKKNEPEQPPELDVSEAFMVGAGVHWKILPGQMEKGLTGHLLPWNMALWGDADVYKSWKHYHPTGAWLQVS